MVLGMLFIGLYPFVYFPPNKVFLGATGNGLHFYARGIALSTGDDGWSNNDHSGNPITLELWVKPARTYYRKIPHILSLCDVSGREVLYLGQWKNSLIVRLMEDSRWIKAIKKEIGTVDVFNPGEKVLITLVLNKKSAYIYLNGHLVRKYDGFDFTKTVSKHPIRSLVLGNSSTGDSPWRGEISGFTAWNIALGPTAIFDRFEQRNLGKSSQTGEEFIKYTFEKTENGIIRNKARSDWNLIIPEILTPLRREFLGMPSKQFLQKRSFYKDSVINVAGFIPFGYVLTVFFSGISLKKYSILNFIFPILIGGLLSLFIETNQVFLVTRSSSMTDLVLNILGTGLGAGVYWRRKVIVPSFKFQISKKT